MNDALMVAQDRSKYPSLARLRAEYGTDKVEGIIILYLIDLCENVNLKRPLRDNQVENIAREIVSEYYALTVADVHVVFRQAKTGAFGEFFDSLDMPKVMQWFRNYFADRCTAAAQQSIDDAGKYRTGGDRRDAERWRYFFERMNKQQNKKDK